MYSAEELLEAARVARENAYAPHSGFAVGAALETDAGLVFGGCNVENATLGLTMCAERVAMFKALSSGHRRFVRIAIVADGPRPVSPCGACRQILWEFGGDLEVIAGDSERETRRYRLSDLLPHAFDAGTLPGGTQRRE
jgi:cytidine deaminase